MAMQPNSCELLGLSAKINLHVEEIGYRLIVKPDADAAHFLFDRDELLYEEQIIRFCDAKTAYFVV